jgi:IMP cyclohydrolase
MQNPNGPYPGRQIFIGRTPSGLPAFAYLVTGRSPASRERRAVPRDNTVVMGPIDDTPYDWLRHYTAVKYDNAIGLLAVSNGIQTEAVYETYRLLYHCGTRPARGYLKKVMDGAGYEPDSLKTPRIVGLVTDPPGKPEPRYLLGIKLAGAPAYAWELTFDPGALACVSTYAGDMAEPKPFAADSGPSALPCDAATPRDLAHFVYDISAAENNGQDIRVAAVAGVRRDDGLTWKLFHLNRHGD